MNRISWNAISRSRPEHTQKRWILALRQSYLHDTVEALWMLPDACHLKTDRFKQRYELFLCPFPCRETSHNAQVQAGGQPVRALFRENKLVDQDLCLALHGRLDLLQDLSTSLVGVVVQDLVEEVRMSS
jgi:hypothetical protein